MRGHYLTNVVFILVTTLLPSLVLALNITVTGVAETHAGALSNALQRAIEIAGSRYIMSEKNYQNGSVISSDTQLVSSGLISNYSVISASEKNGLFIVNISASVDKDIVDHAGEVLNKKVNLNEFDQLVTLNNYQQWLKKASSMLSKLVDKDSPKEFFKRAYITQLSGIEIDSVHMDYIDAKVFYTITPDPMFWSHYNQLISILQHRSDSNVVAESASLGPAPRLCGEYKGQLNLTQSEPRYYIPSVLTSYLAPPIQIQPISQHTSLRQKSYVYKNAIFDGAFYVAMKSPFLYPAEPNDTTKELAHKKCSAELVSERAIHVQNKSFAIMSEFHYLPMLKIGSDFKAEAVTAMLDLKMKVGFTFRVADQKKLIEQLSKDPFDYLKVEIYTPKQLFH